LTRTRHSERFNIFDRAIAALRGATQDAQKPIERSATTERSGKKAAPPPKAGSQTALIQEAAAAFLRARGRPAHTGEILAAILERGITVGGKRQNAVVAAYLSHSPLFANRRDEGYRLVEWSEPKTETPNSGVLFGAPKTNGAMPLSP
jgi:hypothetical protein